MSVLSPWVLVAMVAAALAGFFFGMDVATDHQKAQLLVQAQAMHESYVAKVAEQRAIAQGVSKELNDESIKRQSDAVAFRAELARARTGAVQLAVCNPVGTGVRLTREFSWLYDSALQVGMPRAADPGRVDAPATRSDPVEPADVLANHADNAEAWAECRTALRGWQSIARQYGWVK